MHTCSGPHPHVNNCHWRDPEPLTISVRDIGREKSKGNGPQALPVFIVDGDLAIIHQLFCRTGGKFKVRRNTVTFPRMSLWAAAST